MNIEKTEAKRKGNPYETMPRNRVFMTLVGGFLLVIISITLAIALYRQAPQTPDCGTRAGYQLAFASNSGIYLTDEATGQPNYIAEYPFPATSLTWSPNSQWLTYRQVDGDRQHIQVLNTGGEAVATITFSRNDDRGIHWRWLPDSQTMIVVVPVADGWWLGRWQVGDDEAVTLVNHESNIIPEWALSPDGTQIAAIIRRDNRYDVLFIDTTTGDSRTVVEDVQDSAKIEWSHDGQSVRLINRDLYRITAADGAITSLTENASVEFARWSPDDSRIAYAYRENLFVIPAIEGEAQRVVAGLGGSDLLWSPNGEWLLFVLDGNAGFGFTVWDVGVINVDGSGFVNLTHNQQISFPIAWSADSQYILYQERDDSTGDQPVYILNLATGVTLQASPDSGISADWSPDGRYVAVEINNRLHLVEAATGERCIVHRPASAYPYIWRPVPID